MLGKRRAVERQIFSAWPIEFHMTDRTFERFFGGNIQAWWHMVTIGTFMTAETREQQAQIIEQFGRRSEGRMHAARTWPLTQGNGSWNMEHLINLRARSLADAAPRICRKRLKIPPASFGVEHPKRQRTLSRARNARNTNQLMQRNIHINVLQIVHARTAHLDRLRLMKRSASLLLR